MGQPNQQCQITEGTSGPKDRTSITPGPSHHVTILQHTEWFRSYLHGRSQYVRRGMLKSLSVLLVCGVPQGSVLGPILFILYTAELIGLTEQHGFCPHLYADDTQISGRCRPSATHDLQQRLSACIDEVHS